MKKAFKRKVFLALGFLMAPFLLLLTLSYFCFMLVLVGLAQPAQVTQRQAIPLVLVLVIQTHLQKAQKPIKMQKSW